MKTSMLVIYNDSYVRAGGKWLIADRKSTFVTREQEEVRGGPLDAGFDAYLKKPVDPAELAQSVQRLSARG